MHYNRALAAAKRGDHKAQADVGEVLYFACHHEADAVAWRPPCDPQAAIKWNLAAAESGNARSQYLLGQIYRLDAPDQALKWFRKSAEQGNASAAGELARMYEYGTGVKQDWSEVYFWSSVCPTASPSYIEQARRHLTSRQEAIVDARVAEWRKAHPVLPITSPSVQGAPK